MNPSRLFIERPVATTLLAIGFTLGGAVTFVALPVASLPEVDVPTISVQANVPGAGPETMAATVATPLERALGRIAGVTEMTSNSTLGATNIVLQFDLARDIDGAARDVQAAINAARTNLPTSLKNNPTYRKVNPADAPVLDLALTSDTLTQGAIYDYADSVLAQKFAQVKGIGQVDVDGGSQPAVRIELDPLALSHYAIDSESVRVAVSAQNANRPLGVVEEGARQWQIAANDGTKNASDYALLPVAYRNGALVRLSDLATVEDSVQDVRNYGSANGKPAVLVHLKRQPGANIVETLDRVKALLPELRAAMPQAIAMDVVLDRTPSIRASLREIERTLLISIVLVILVVLFFLRNARATLIPAVAVPVSLIVSFGAIYLFGFTLDNLSLMALTVATGFVVDDAVVVLEHVSRLIEGGMRPLGAALRGAKEVGFTVLSMSLSLVAVFIPILLMGGLVGRFFREFALTLSAAVLVSLLVSLTLTPMMCARLLRARPVHADRAERETRIARWARIATQAMQGGYERSLAAALGAQGWVMLVFVATIALTIWLYALVPKGFFPQQDTGRVPGMIVADQATSFQAMLVKLKRYIAIVENDPAVEGFTAHTGGGQRNGARMLIGLKPAAERNGTTDAFIARIRAQTADLPGATLFLQTEQDIRIGGRAANAQYQYTLQADDLAELRRWEPRVRNALARLPELADVSTDSQDKGQETLLAIDRDASSRLGLSALSIDTALYNLFGQRQISTIYSTRNQYRS